MGMGIELKNVTKELEQEREKAAKSETSTISSFKSKLTAAENKVKEAAAAALVVSEEQDTLKESLRVREVKINDLEDELGRVRGEYSALLTKMTMQRYQAGGPSSDDVRGDSNGDSSAPRMNMNMPTNVVDQPLLTEDKLKLYRSRGAASRLPAFKPSGNKPAKSFGKESANLVSKLYVPPNFKTLSDTLNEKAAAREASVDDVRDVRGPSRAPSKLREGDGDTETETWRNIEQQRKKMEELTKITFEEKETNELDDDDSDRDMRRSSRNSFDVKDVGTTSSNPNLTNKPVVVAVEEAALAVSEENLTGDSPATDAEFAAFQAQFVGGMTLSIIGGSFGNKTKRKTKVFTIRFLPKKGLTLCWGKKDTVVLSTVLEVACGSEGSGGSGRNTTPLRMSKGRPSWVSTTAPVDKSNVLIIRYGAERNVSPRTSEDRSDRGGSSVSRPSISDQSLSLEAKSSSQRDHIARCMRRLANQERERNSVYDM